MKVILAEKPSVAREIASVLNATSKKDGYIEGNGYAVTWAFGHLVGLANPDEYSSDLKSWSMKTLPFIPSEFKLALNKSTGVAKQFNTIKNLFQAADEIISGVDSGREGELIFRYIYDLTGVKNIPIKRLWISSLTNSAIKAGFNDLRSADEYNNLALAARARSESDWVVGLNATRAYTVNYSNNTGVLSVGRVQTPVLAMIVNRDIEIENFSPEPYWELTSKYRDVIFKYTEGRLDKEEGANALRDKIVGELMTIVEIERKDKSEKPPQLYDLTTLQRQMNSSYSYSATKTLSLLQSLYEKKFVTYPRTDSRYLTDDIYPECESILQKLSSLHTGISKLNLSTLRKEKSVFNDSKVADHHAVIPTGIVPQGLSSEEQNIFNAILLRFIVVFYPDCKKGMTTIKGEVTEIKFEAKGVSIMISGWRELESPGKETTLPVFNKGETGPQIPLVTKSLTKPPQQFSEASLLGAMETAGKDISEPALKEAMKERGLGTPATRANVIETLLKREYLVRSKKHLLSTFAIHC